MPTGSSNFCGNSKPESDLRCRVQSGATIRRGVPTCILHTNHPLVFRAIKHFISSDPDLRHGIRAYSDTVKPSAEKNCEILVLDTCSVEDWHKSLQTWQSEGGRTIALISPDVQHETELELVYLGIAGIVAFSDDVLGMLPAAVHAVLQGKLWIKREVLSEYVRRTNMMLRRFSSLDPRFTAREHQIVDFLRQGHSNRQIANRLDISERTVKFHVSNILKKCNIENRRDLLTASFNSSSSTILAVGNQYTDSFLTKSN
jgi:DNA-binding NarL/FixJ family response regulator